MLESNVYLAQAMEERGIRDQFSKQTFYTIERISHHYWEEAEVGLCHYHQGFFRCSNSPTLKRQFRLHQTHRFVCSFVCLFIYFSIYKYNQ